MYEDRDYYDCDYEEYLPARRQRPPRHHWSIVPWAMLLGAILFGCGFLFGTVRAAEARASKADMFLTDSAPTASAAPAAQPLSLPMEPAAPPVSSDAPKAVEDDWALVLVNRDNPIPEDYIIPELVELRNNQSFDRRAYPELQRMMDDCRAAGLDPMICSSYRTHEFQTELFENKVDRCMNEGDDRAEAEIMAAQWVAVPGTSEHELGLAVDIVDTGYQNLDEAQENTAVQQWLMEHCRDYGFILRYPTEKADITGIGYEPWHYRYVGSAAGEIMEQGLCLEEYLAR